MPELSGYGHQTLNNIAMNLEFKNVNFSSGFNQDGNWLKIEEAEPSQIVNQLSSEILLEEIDFAELFSVANDVQLESIADAVIRKIEPEVLIRQMDRAQMDQMLELLTISLKY